MSEGAPQDLKPQLVAWTEAEAMGAQRLSKRFALLSGVRLALAVAGIAGALAAGSQVGAALGLQVAGLATLLFLLLVVWHASVAERRDTHRRALAYFGARYRAAVQRNGLPRRDYALDERAADLDFGVAGGLLARIDACVFGEGSAQLLHWLCLPELDPAAASQRQHAVRALLSQPELLRHWAQLAQGETWLEGRSYLCWAQQAATRHPGTLLGALCIPLLWLGASLGLAGHPIQPWAYAFALVAAIALLTRSRVGHQFPDTGHGMHSLRAALKQLQAAEAVGVLEAAGVPPAQREATALSEQSLTRAARWLSLLSLREQALLHLPLNLLTGFDLWLSLGLGAVRRELSERLPPALEAIAHFDALQSLAWFSSTEAGVAWPKLTERPQFCARELSHPLLSPADRVANSLKLPEPGTPLLVTGSNMAGKSTLLRAVGLNWCLANAGAVVTAASLSLGPTRLRSTMRIADSLVRGESHFAAELRRVGQLIEGAAEAPPVLFLMDELFRGTNAQARHEASAGVLDHLLGHGALGIFASHDTALQAHRRLSAYPKLQSAHFTDHIVDGQMRFDYTLRPGVVQSSNALRLVAALGIALDDPGTTR